MTGDRSYDDEYNLFSCLSRLVSAHLSTLSRKLNRLTCLVEHDINSTEDLIPVEPHKLKICTFLLRNPWLPGWILTTTLILSVLVLIWICCATVATAVDQYVPTEVSFQTIPGCLVKIQAQSRHVNICYVLFFFFFFFFNRQVACDLCDPKNSLFLEIHFSSFLLRVI